MVCMSGGWLALISWAPKNVRSMLLWRRETAPIIQRGKPGNNALFVDVGELAVIGLRPNVETIISFDQLYGNTQTIP